MTVSQSGSSQVALPVLQSHSAIFDARRSLVAVTAFLSLSVILASVMAFLPRASYALPPKNPIKKVIATKTRQAKEPKATGDYVWLEAESFTSTNLTKPNIAGWGHPEWLSGDKWLQISVDADKLDKELPR